jgi:rhodanese-related sulfurtransferase
MRKLFLLAATSALLLGGMTTIADVGEITATEAYNMLDPGSDSTPNPNYNPNAYILDVRTPAEWYFVGHPGMATVTNAGAFLEGKVINIPFWLWEYAPNMGEYAFAGNINKFFDAAVARHFSPQDTIILMCRSGGRAGYAGVELEDPSQPASNRLEELGYYYLYNMKGGFEASGGWLPSRLPYNKAADGIWKPSDQQGRSLK